MKKGIIFDMDGTLFDTERIYRDAWKAMADEFCITHDPEFPKAVCGTNGAKMVEIVNHFYPDVDADAFIQGCLSWAEKKVENFIPEKPGLHEILNFAKDHNLKIAVASSSSKKTILHHLRLTGLLETFDVITSGEEVEKGKPEPDIFLAAASRLGLDPSECYVIEDGMNGILAGVAAGCTTVMVPDWTPPTAELELICAGIYDSLLCVIDAIEREEI